MTKRQCDVLASIKNSDCWDTGDYTDLYNLYTDVFNVDDDVDIPETKLEAIKMFYRLQCKAMGYSGPLCPSISKHLHNWKI